MAFQPYDVFASYQKKKEQISNPTPGIPTVKPVTAQQATPSVGSNTGVNSPLMYEQYAAKQTGNPTPGIPSVSPALNVQSAPLTEKQGIAKDIKTSTDAQIASTTASINSVKEQKINELKQAYQAQVDNGELSINDAKAAFDEQVKQVEQLHYQDAEASKLAAEHLGIQNSQQMLGMQASDNARKNYLINENMTKRDKSIADIKTRLAGLQKEQDLAIANATSEAGYKTVDATNAIRAQGADRQTQLDVADYQSNKQQQFAQQNMATQHGYDVENREDTQSFQAGMAKQQHIWDFQSMQDQQQWQEHMTKLGANLEWSNQQKGILLNNKLDVAKMEKQFEYNVKSMAIQFGYDMSKISKQQKNAIENIGKEAAAKAEAEQKAYELARSRELAKYDPNTPEYKIHAAQMEDAFKQKIDEIHSGAVYKGISEAVLKDESYLSLNGKAPVPPENANKAQVDQYVNQYNAYQRAQKVLNGTVDYRNPEASLHANDITPQQTQLLYDRYVKKATVDSREIHISPSMYYGVKK